MHLLDDISHNDACLPALDSRCCCLGGFTGVEIVRGWWAVVYTRTALGCFAERESWSESRGTLLLPLVCLSV